MKEKAQEKLVAKLAKQLKSILPRFVEVKEMYSLNRQILNGPRRHFLRFDCDLSGSGAGYYQICVEVDRENVTASDVMALLFLELGAKCQTRGSDATRIQVASGMLKSAGLEDLLKKE